MSGGEVSPNDPTTLISDNAQLDTDPVDVLDSVTLAIVVENTGVEGVFSETLLSSGIDVEPTITVPQASDSDSIAEIEIKFKKSGEPVRPMTSYLLWSQKVRPKYKKMHNNPSFEEMTMILSREWQKLSDKTKKPYREVATRARREYDRLMSQHRILKRTRETQMSVQDDVSKRAHLTYPVLVRPSHIPMAPPNAGMFMMPGRPWIPSAPGPSAQNVPGLHRIPFNPYYAYMLPPPMPYVPPTLMQRHQVYEQVSLDISDPGPGPGPSGSDPDRPLQEDDIVKKGPFAPQ